MMLWNHHLPSHKVIQEFIQCENVLKFNLNSAHLSLTMYYHNACIRDCGHKKSQEQLEK